MNTHDSTPWKFWALLVTLEGLFSFQLLAAVDPTPVPPKRIEQTDTGGPREKKPGDSKSPPEELTEAERRAREADRTYQQGTRALDRRQYEDAVKAFEMVN